MCRPGFTLIELLVVITIIVVLLTLLTPALDQAVYRAELTRCAANMRGVGASVTMYATNQRGYYPSRNIAENRAMNIGGGGIDFRPGLAPYLSFKQLVDPFCKPVDLSIEANDSSIYTYSSNWLWFGWHLTATDPSLRKIGDRLVWTEAGPPPESYRFPYLISDGIAIDPANYWVQASHPDREGRFVADSEIQVLCLTCAGAKLTYSLWITGNYRPGFSMDCNYLRTDLSSEFRPELKFNDDALHPDDRLVVIPERIGGQKSTLANYLPKPDR